MPQYPCLDPYSNGPNNRGLVLSELQPIANKKRLRNPVHKIKNPRIEGLARRIATAAQLVHHCQRP